MGRASVECWVTCAMPATCVRGVAMCGDDGWREGGVQVRKKLGVSHNEFISQGGNKWRRKKFKGDG